MESEIKQIMKYKAKHYYQNEEVAARYFKKRFLTISGRLNHYLEKSFLRNLVKNIEVNTALDVACGTGRLTKELLLLKIDSVTGVDISEEMIEKAVNYCNINNAKAEFKVSDATALSFDENSFDLVISFRFFDHLPFEKKKEVLLELTRCSRKYILFTMANKNKITSFARKIRRILNKNYYEGYLSDESDILSFLDTINVKALKQKMKLPFLAMETMYFCEVK